MIKSQFESLLIAIESYFPDIREGLNPPATSSELDSLTKLFESPLPNQLIELLKVNNGQSSAAPRALGGFSFYPTTSIPRMREANNFPNSNPFWIPLGGAEPFELVIDADPNSETSNQLFMYDAESVSHPLIAKSLPEYIQLTTEKIASGDCRKLLNILFINHDPIGHITATN